MVGAALLAGCATGGLGSAVPEEQDSQAASPANIASLTEVVQRNPNDAQAYNVRGSVLGRAGRNQEALADFDRATGKLTVGTELMDESRFHQDYVRQRQAQLQAQLNAERERERD